MIQQLKSAFIQNDYPFWPFNYQTAEISIHVRVPPAIPPEILALGFSAHQAVASCPAIERISIAPELRGRGLFTEIQNVLLSIHSVYALCITNVYEERHRQHLLHHPNWKKLPIVQEHSVHAPCRNFYQLTTTKHRDANRYNY